MRNLGKRRGNFAVESHPADPRVFEVSTVMGFDFHNLFERPVVVSPRG